MGQRDVHHAKNTLLLLTILVRYLRQVEAKLPCDQLIFFDFQTDQSLGEHFVNFTVAQYINGEEKVFKGYSVCSDF